MPLRTDILREIRSTLSWYGSSWEGLLQLTRATTRNFVPEVSAVVAAIDGGASLETISDHLKTLSALSGEGDLLPSYLMQVRRRIFQCLETWSYVHPYTSGDYALSEAGRDHAATFYTALAMIGDFPGVKNLFTNTNRFFSLMLVEPEKTLVTFSQYTDITHKLELLPDVIATNPLETVGPILEYFRTYDADKLPALFATRALQSHKTLLWVIIESAPDHLGELLELLRASGEESVRQTLTRSSRPWQDTGINYLCAANTYNPPLLPTLLEAVLAVENPPPGSRLWEDTLQTIFGRPFAEPNTTFFTLRDEPVRFLAALMQRHERPDAVTKILTTQWSSNPGDHVIGFITSYPGDHFRHFLEALTDPAFNGNRNFLMRVIFSHANKNAIAADIFMNFVLNHPELDAEILPIHTLKSQHNILHIAARYAPGQIGDLLTRVRRVNPDLPATLLSMRTTTENYTPLMMCAKHKPAGIPILLDEIVQLPNCKNILQVIGTDGESALTLANRTSSESGKLIAKAINGKYGTQSAPGGLGFFAAEDSPLPEGVLTYSPSAPQPGTPGCH